MSNSFLIKNIHSEKIKLKVKSMVSEDKKPSLALVRAYFYIMFSSFSTHDIYPGLNMLQEMKLENELINDFKSLNVEKINKLKSDTFDSVYGQSSCNYILNL